MKIIVAISAASGAIYARQLIERLIENKTVKGVALIFSDDARRVVEFEGVTIPTNPKIRIYDNEDMFSPLASGSAAYDAMVIVPCSVGSLGRIAAGVSSSLIGRAADVTLKERRKLILVVRESPYSLIHLRNMCTVTESGGIIIPASPSFYSHPRNIGELAFTVTNRILAHLGIAESGFQWGVDYAEANLGDL